MITLRHLALGLSAGLAVGSIWSGAPAAAQDDTITLGAAVSITGKYSTNGKNTKDGYDLAVKVINDKGGVKVGDKTYQLEVTYYDDESTPARAAQLTERAALAAGLVTALAILVRPNLAPLAAVLGVWLLLDLRWRRSDPHTGRIARLRCSRSRSWRQASAWARSTNPCTAPRFAPATAGSTCCSRGATFSPTCGST